jgi:hypothetical protein
VTAARRAISVGIWYVLMRFYFPQALVVPVALLAAVLYSAEILGRFRVRLDAAGGGLAITTWFWTRHLPLTRIERVDEVLRFGAAIKTGGGLTYRFGPFRKRRQLERWLRIRTGFEGMELAVTAATAASSAGASSAGEATSPGVVGLAPAAGPAPAATGPTAAVGCCGAGLLSLAVAALVQPQAGGWLVHAGAVLLRIMYGGGGAAAVLIGAWTLIGVCRGRCTAVGGT